MNGIELCTVICLTWTGSSTPLPWWESRPIPEEPEVHFYFNHLHRHWFYRGETEHTADRAHPTQVLEPSTDWSLHSTLKKKEVQCMKQEIQYSVKLWLFDDQILLLCCSCSTTL